jgi:hypothetical protein
LKGSRRHNPAAALFLRSLHFSPPVNCAENVLN